MSRILQFGRQYKKRSMQADMFPSACTYYLMHRIRKERHKYVVYTHNIMVNRIGALKTIF
jgi:hypothetical protein